MTCVPKVRIFFFCILASLFWGATSTRAQGLFEQAVQESKSDSGKETNKQPTESYPTKLSLAGLAFELNGYVRGDLFLGKHPEKTAMEAKAGYGEAALKIRARKGDWGDAFSELRVRSGYENGEADTIVDLREAYVNLFLGPLDLKLGHQIIIWGRADGVNPTNNLTPQDMRIRSPAEDDMRRGNLALRTHLNLDPVRWEVVWVPIFAPSYFPNFQLPGGITLAEPTWPNAHLKNSTIATRLHFLLPAFEFSVSYLYGTSTFPGIEFQNFSPETTSVVVAFTAYRHQVVGADFSTTIGPIGLRGEIAFRRAYEYDQHEYTPRPDLQYVLGIEKEFWNQLSIIAQYNGKIVFDWDEDPASAVPPATDSSIRPLVTKVVEKNRMVAGQLEQIQHSATLRVQWNLLQETLHLEALAMYNFSTQELLANPKISYDIADALTVAAGA
ncbi:MAG: DUF1302 family protein, partial [Pseudomonadota bacterium]